MVRSRGIPHGKNRVTGYRNYFLEVLSKAASSVLADLAAPRSASTLSRLALVLSQQRNGYLHNDFLLTADSRIRKICQKTFVMS